MWPIVVMLALAAGPEAAPAHGEGIAVRDPSGCVGVIATPLPPGYRVEVEVAHPLGGDLGEAGVAGIVQRVAMHSDDGHAERLSRRDGALGGDLAPLVRTEGGDDHGHVHSCSRCR